MLTARRAAAIVLSVIVLGAAAGCGAAPEPAGQPDPAVTPTSGGEVGDATPGTAPAARDDDPIDGIGEDDAFPELGTPALDVDDYELDLRYDVETGELEGTATIDATVTVESATIELDFQGLDVTSTTVDGDDVDHELVQDEDKLVLDLGEPVGAGTDVTVEVSYAGVPEPVATEALGGVEVGWHAGTGGSFVLSEPEGASTWYPVNNHPLDKATYTFRVTVPEPYTAIANGELVATTSAEGGREDGSDGPGASGGGVGADAGGDGVGATTFEYRMDAPMASYLATVVTGQFERVDGGVHDGVTYTYWYAAGVDRSPSLEQTNRDVAQLSRHLGPFPFTTYGGIVYPPSFINGSGRTEDFLSGVALENQGASLYAEGTTVPMVILHEAAHQWMGDNVSLTDWSRDIWWIEGFARFAEYVDDPDEMADAELEVRANWVPPGDLSADELFSVASYDCGGMVFYALYREVGADTFWAILREFNERYRHANASTDDLIEVASDVSGEDLTDFFQAWLFDETPPRLPA